MTFSLPLLPCDSLTQTPGSPVCLRTGNRFTGTVANVLQRHTAKQLKSCRYPWCPFHPAGKKTKLQLPVLIPWISKHSATLGLNTFLLAAHGSLFCCRQRSSRCLVPAQPSLPMRTFTGGQAVCVPLQLTRGRAMGWRWNRERKKHHNARNSSCRLYPTGNAQCKPYSGQKNALLSKL